LEKLLKGAVVAYILVLSHNLAGGTEENNEKLVRITCVPAKI
jgi:hypothetical protein